MKNKLWAVAGAFLLVAVLGKFYAVPAIAQTVRAAWVKNVDERGRNPYNVIVTCSDPNLSCTAIGSAVPQGYQLVIENVNLSVVLPTGSPIRGLSLYNSTSAGETLLKSLIPVPVGNDGTNSLYVVNDNVVAYVSAGQTPQINFFSEGSGHIVGTITGHLVNLNE